MRLIVDLISNIILILAKVKYAAFVAAIICVIVGVILGIVTRRREEQARVWMENNKRDDSLPYE